MTMPEWTLGYPGFPVGKTRPARVKSHANESMDVAALATG